MALNPIKSLANDFNPLYQQLDEQLNVVPFLPTAEEEQVRAIKALSTIRRSIMESQGSFITTLTSSEYKIFKQKIAAYAFKNLGYPGRFDMTTTALFQMTDSIYFNQESALQQKTTISKGSKKKVTFATSPQQQKRTQEHEYPYGNIQCDEILPSANDESKN